MIPIYILIACIIIIATLCAIDSYQHGGFGNYYIQQTEFHAEAITMVWHNGQVVKEFVGPVAPWAHGNQKVLAKHFISSICP